MPSLKQRILLIGPWDERLTEIGAALVPNLNEAMHLTDSDWDVVGVSATAFFETRFESFLQAVKSHRPWVRLVLSAPNDISTARLIELHHRHPFDKILNGYSLEEAEVPLYHTLEVAQHQHQVIETERLLRDQEKKLNSLRDELETRVEKRTRLLAESRHNLHVQNQKLEALGRSLLAAQQASSIGDLERLLSETLASVIEISWIRILPGQRRNEFEQQIARMQSFAWKNIPLWKGRDEIGSIFFMRPLDRPFRKDDNAYLTKVSEAVSLALDRLTQVHSAEILKEQWDATFAAITSPMALIKKKYMVLQSNQPEAAGQPCYQVFFQRQKPCDGCQRGQNFRLQQNGKIYDVQSQVLPLDSQNESLYVHLYTDVTDRVNIENRVLESAKMVELGTISSSIAHELNNPIGGVLNFAQLLKMELPSDHPLQPDLRAFEDGARRCKEIVENLLGFSRQQTDFTPTHCNLQIALEKACQLVGLRAKANGIQIHIQEIPEPLFVHASMNMLIQAFRGLLDWAMKLAVPAPAPWVKVVVEASPTEIHLLLLDSGKNEGADSPPALQMTEQILQDQGARIDKKLDSSPEIRAKISFTRPVLRS